MAAKAIIVAVAAIMALLSLSPLRFALFYLVVRPMLGPIAMEHNTLFAGIPLTGVLPVIVTSYSFGYTLLRRSATFFPPASIPLYLLLAASTLSFYNSMSLSTSMAGFLKLATAPAFYVLTYNCLRSEADVRSTLYGCLTASLVPMAVGYIQYLTNAKARGGIVLLEDRICGTLNFPNAYGEFLAIGLFAALMLLLMEKRTGNRLLITGIALSMLVSSVIALNRGTWIAMSGALLTAYLIFPNRIKLRVVIVPLVLVSILFTGKIASRFTELRQAPAVTTDQVAPNTFLQRVGLWTAALRLVPHHPVTGFGLATAEMVNERYYDNSDPPHNDYIRILLECGILGLLCFIAFTLRLISASFALRRFKDDWTMTLPLFGLVLYWTLISAVQNLITDVVNFPFFLCVVATAMKWKHLKDKGGDFADERKN